MSDEELRLAALRSYAILDTPPEEAYDRLIQFVVGACGVPMAALTLLDADRLSFKAIAGVDADMMARGTRRATSFLTLCIQQHGLTVIPDVAADPRFADGPQIPAQPDIRFFACAPLVSPEGFAIGALVIMDRVPREPNAQQVKALEGFADHAMLLLEQHRQNLFLKALQHEQSQAAQREAETRESLLAILQDIASPRLSLFQVLDTMAERLMALMKPTGVQIELLEGAELVRYTSVGGTTPDVGQRMDARSGLSGLAVTTGKTQYCADSETDPLVDRDYCRATNVRSLIVTPLRVNEQTIGIIRLTSHLPGGFSQSDVTRLAVLGESLGGAIQRHRLSEEMRKSEEKYRVLFEDNPRSMWVYDPQTLKFLAVNQATERVFGYTRAELLTMDILDLWVPSEGDEKRTRAEAEAAIRRIPLHSRSETLRRRQRRKDGSFIEVELSGNGVQFEGKPARMVHVLDITNRTQAEKEVARLARAQQMLSTCNEALIRATDEQQLLQRICEVAVNIGGYLMAWVGFAQDDPEKTIVPTAHAGKHGPLVTTMPMSWDEASPAGQNSAGRTIRSGQIDVIPDILKVPTFAKWRGFSQVVGHRGLIGLPLRRGSTTFGAICLYAPETLTLSGEEQKLLEELANDLAFGINNLRALNEQRRLQAAVLKVGAAVSRQSGEEFYEHLVMSLVDAVEAQAGYVSLLLPGPPCTGQTLFAAMDGKPIEDFAFQLDNSPIADYQQKDAWLLPADVVQRYPTAPFIARVGAKACVVRRLDNSEGQPIGLLAVLFREALKPTQTDFVDSMLRIFAARAASELERQQADAHIRDQASLLDKARDAISVRGLDHRITYWNEGCRRVYGWSAEEVIGKSTVALLYDDTSIFETRNEQVMRDGDWSGELVQRRKDGSTVVVEARWTLVRGENGEPKAVLAINTDITRRKEAEEAVHRLAFYDSLTRLPNRQLFNVTLQQARRASAASGASGALLFVNLDNFKAVNETLGHVKGDILLKLAAERILSVVSQGDTVARIGGDEFLILLQPRHSSIETALADAANVAEQILQAFAAPFALEDFEHLTTACIGIAAFKGIEVEDGELLKQVDLALYQAKSVGRGVIRFYDPRLQLAVAERAMLETELRQAMENKELELYYQPQIQNDGRIFGVEALLRWKHPRRGMVSPGLFVPVAEESGLILGIGQWVIESACRQLAAWRARPETAALTMSVNVSASQFRHDDFVEQVATAAREAGIAAGSLKLELTESLLVYDMEAIIQKMQRLKAQGLGLSLDDFGTGYSSLSYLKRMPLDQLKIDQSFVRDVMTDPNDAAIAKTVIGLAHSLGLMVIAEGVEQQEQRDFLFENGCDAYQGYLLSRPLPLRDLEVFLARQAGEGQGLAVGVPSGLQPASGPATGSVQPQTRQSQIETLIAVTEAIPAMIAVNGPDERYRFVNRAFERWFGVSSAAMIGRTSLQVLGPAEYERSRPWINKVMAGETVSFEKEFVNRRPPVHIAVSFIPLRLASGELDGYVTVAQDVTHHREEAVRLLQLSERDTLTGLLNRRGFENYLEQAIAAGGAPTLALLYVDLDHFKPVNDLYGHPVGDVVLREFAQRLRQLVRPNDAVARLGGDEFAIVLSGVPSKDQGVVVADKILAAAHAPFEIGERHLSIGASVGLAYDASDNEGLTGLIKRADAMLYQAKAAGRGRWA
jgi:diguanylate cyclase (GGDEF)-like protein/PAS domain S-box-containing protein